MVWGVLQSYKAALDNVKRVGNNRAFETVGAVLGAACQNDQTPLVDEGDADRGEACAQVVLHDRNSRQSAASARVQRPIWS